VQQDRLSYRYTAKDGLEVACHLHFSPIPERLTEQGAAFAVTLEAHESVTLELTCEIESGLAAVRQALPRFS